MVDVTMDGRGQILDVTREYPTGPGTTAYTYDANGNRLSITDPRGQVMGGCVVGALTLFITGTLTALQLAIGAAGAAATGGVGGVL